MENLNNGEKKGLVSWIDARLPVFTFINHNLRDYPTPKNLNYFWNFSCNDCYRYFVGYAIYCQYRDGLR